LKASLKRRRTPGKVMLALEGARYPQNHGLVEVFPENLQPDP
jgi:hypothetical protein